MNIYIYIHIYIQIGYDMIYTYLFILVYTHTHIYIYIYGTKYTDTQMDMYACIQYAIGLYHLKSLKTHK